MGRIDLRLVQGQIYSRGSTFRRICSVHLEKLGAEVLSTEGDLINLLRCRAIKNALSHSTTFLLGDSRQFMERSDRRFDICWASGVLYHANIVSETVQINFTDRIGSSQRHKRA